MQSDAHNKEHGGQENRLLPTVATLFWFKVLGTTGFITLFFGAYLYLLKNPAYAATTMPLTAADQFIGFEPLALPIYLSLWAYVSLPPMLMRTRRAIIEYGIWIGGLCLFALVIFYFFPNAVPSANIDWGLYPGMAFLKDVDAAGNACLSLHVATAVFSGFWIHWLLPRVGLNRWSRLISALWCIAIAYSTMATKQHVAVDVVAGGALGVLFAWHSKPKDF
jgi:membrane-associated phospholipid phosphatase